MRGGIDKTHGTEVPVRGPTFRSGHAPSGQFDAPSAALVAEKTEFGRSRVARWFGREWQPLEPAPSS